MVGELLRHRAHQQNVYFTLRDSSGEVVEGISFTSGMSKLWKSTPTLSPDETFSNTVNLPVETSAPGLYKVLLTAEEMDSLDVMTLMIEDTSSPANWVKHLSHIQPYGNHQDDTQAGDSSLRTHFRDDVYRVGGSTKLFDKWRLGLSSIIFSTAQGGQQPSTDAWVIRDTPAVASYWTSVAYGNGRFVAVGTSGTNRVMVSKDGGFSWELFSATEANQWRSVTFGNGIFVAVSSNGTNRVMTSPDGETWTARSAAEANSWQTVTFGDNLFVAVATSGTNRVMSSPDGVTWTAHAATQANQWQSVTYGGGVYVAVASSGTKRVMTSTDGASWTPRDASEASGWWGVAYGGGVFVAVAISGTNRIMTSPDGINWTSKDEVIWDTEWLYRVAFGGGKFVAVTSRFILSSDDLGESWVIDELQQSPPSSSSLSNVVYGETGFVVIGSTSKFFRSSDGQEGYYFFDLETPLATPDDNGNTPEDPEGYVEAVRNPEALVGRLLIGVAESTEAGSISTPRVVGKITSSGYVTGYDSYNDTLQLRIDFIGYNPLQSNSGSEFTFLVV